MFNTGNHVYRVVSREDFFDHELGDAYFEEDGSYVINIPEMNPFFPYEVEFTYEGKKVREWFMTPDDCVEIGGHDFYVSACFDGTVVTQMNLKVAEDTVVVYPKEKEFTDEVQGEINPLSLLPLEKRDLTVDLSDYTPVELTMVSVDGIFTGENALQSTDKIAWTKAYEDDFVISFPGDNIDLSYDTCYASSYGEEWEMIVGDADQLNGNNIRYRINIKITSSRNWLTVKIGAQDDLGTRTSMDLPEDDVDYYDYYNGERELNMWVPSNHLGEDRMAYVGLDINRSVFSHTGYAELKVYEGIFTSASEALSGTDITNQIMGVDLNNADTGYLMELYDSRWFTMVTFDSAGQPTGCLPFEMYLGNRNMENHISSGNLFTMTAENQIIYITDRQQNRRKDGYNDVTYTLYKGYKAEEKYHLKLSYYTEGECDDSKVTAAYVGNYSSIAEAVRAGRENIKDELLGDSRSGFQADYSQVVDFTIFVGEDGMENQEIYHYKVKAVEGMREPPLSGNTYVNFYGVVDKDGRSMDSYVLEKGDSYAEGAYITILVDKDVDLTRLALEFTAHNLKLYAEGSSGPEVSGESYHDFSQGAVQFTASAENGIGSKNYWIQVVPVGTGSGKLYINSLADKEAKTRVENGITYSIREMYLDGRYDYVHDIVLVNIGKEELPALSAELVSEEVELDDYWSLSGNSSFQGVDIDGMYSSLAYGDLWNQTKDTNTLKRAAQNYEITNKSSGSGSGGSSGGSGSSSSSGSTSSSSSSVKTPATSDAKKGQVNSQTGIITGAGAGYSRWQQDEAGWKLIYADGTIARGHLAEQSDGTVVEQILWELINGRWYAFGADGNLKSGWVFDYALSGWYFVSTESGMQSGWHQDPTDGYYYYLEPTTGKIAAGWKAIDGKWYYFNEIVLQSTWNYDEKTGTWHYDAMSKHKPYGAMYSDEMTPDRYVVGKDGAWDGREKK